MSYKEMDLRAGVIGLGMIGGGIAASLVNRGRIPAVYDVIPDAYAKHAGVPVQLPSAAEVAAASDVLMLAVFDGNQAREVLISEQGILSRAHDKLVVVLVSTVTVDEAKELAGLCAQSNVAFLDCGVSPGSLASKNGLCAIVGGDDSVLEYARPVLEDWSASIIHCGAVGTGMAAKVARNVNTFGMWRVVAESTRLAMEAGVSPAKYLQLLEELDKVENLFYNFLRKCAESSDGKLPERMREIYPKFMQKDLGASKALADSLNVSTPVLDMIIELIPDTCDML